MRAPVDTIPAPPFPPKMTWVNSTALPIHKQRGRPVLVEFFDVMRHHTQRTLPYVTAWHERYAEAGLRVIGVHCTAFDVARDEHVARAAIERLGITHPVVLDPALEIWTWYATRGVPSRYLFGPELKLFEYHHGEGGYAETERAIQELLGIERDPVPFVRPQDDPDALLVVPSEDVEGAHRGPYEAGEVWAITSGTGEMTVDGRTIAVTEPGPVLLAAHEEHTAGVLDLVAGPGVTVHATCFAAGLAPEGARPGETV